MKLRRRNLFPFFCCSAAPATAHYARTKTWREVVEQLRTYKHVDERYRRGSKWRAIEALNISEAIVWIPMQSHDRGAKRRL